MYNLFFNFTENIAAHKIKISYFHPKLCNFKFLDLKAEIVNRDFFWLWKIRVSM